MSGEYHWRVDRDVKILKKTDVLEELRVHLGMLEVCPENIMLEITELSLIHISEPTRH